MDVLALAQTLAQLLALGGQFVDEGSAKALAGSVPLHHDAVGLLQTFCKRLSYSSTRFSNQQRIEERSCRGGGQSAKGNPVRRKSPR